MPASWSAPALALAAFGSGASALPQSPTERAQVFATCAGRLSGLEMHQFLTDGPASEQTALWRDSFVGLLEAVMPDAEAAGLPPARAMAWRVEAKAAQAALLADAAFSPDRRRAEPARRAAEAAIAVCLGLLLGS